MTRNRTVRRDHRVRLAAHFALLAIGLVASFTANRFLSPTTFWAAWVAVVWLIAFAIHLTSFARATLATMGESRRVEGSPASQAPEDGTQQAIPP